MNYVLTTPRLLRSYVKTQGENVKLNFELKFKCSKRRSWEIQSHVAEPFWYIHLAYRTPEGACDFSWRRGRLFDKDAATVLYEVCAEEPVATVLSNEGRERLRYAPPPLSTLEMQKKGTQYLRMPGERWRSCSRA